MIRKGILLAGGLNTRLFPITKSVSKHLLPIYDKPLIYYPLSCLMLANIRDILIISNESNLSYYKILLGDGSDIGINLTYEIQSQANGIAESFLIGKNFLNNSPVALILGDNIFYGNNLSNIFKDNSSNFDVNTIFAYKVSNPNQFGVVEFDSNFKVKSIEEKPIKPRSNYVVTGLYFYDNKVVDIASELKPSSRNELEITDLNNIYLSKNNLKVHLLGRGISWLDCGTPDLLLQAQSFVQTIQNRQSIKIACIEEIAFNNKWISKDDLASLIFKYPKNEYSEYIKDLIK